MSIKTFTDEQIAGLIKNNNVLKFSGTYITYTPEFKARAVKQYFNEGKSPMQIFTQAGFDLSVIGKKKAKSRMIQWRKIYAAKGVAGFIKEHRGRPRGRRKKIIPKGLTDEEKIKRLELEVRYLKKENDFLIRLRAKRAE
ncbi:HTH domain-containing protein [Mucilaginibacter sp.]|uniref:HTH domain-containing protein n=1 Tax=Mucilaginibacter sp. TaxID=1882438 RepID=UPI0025E50041|nr:HTH domain-containing protein [Mucilaginibacter sp.]